MIRILLTYAFALLTFTTATADGWRGKMRHLVEEGNKQYERSYRRGILLYADSIKAELSNCPTKNDSLEFTADYLKLMGDYHYENTNYDVSSFAIAESYYYQALAIYKDNEDVFSDLDVDRAPMMHRELAQLYYKQGRYTEARDEMEQAYAAYQDAADLGGIDSVLTPDLYMDYLDMRTFLAICKARLNEDSSADMDEVISYYEKSKANLDNREAQEKYHEALRKKGKIIMLAGGAGAEALTYYKDYFTWRKADALATLATMTAEEREDYWMRMRPFVADAYQTEDADAAFLYDITLFVKGLLLQIERLSGRGKTTDEALASLSYTWRDVQRQLRANECAVEFIQYEKGGQQLMAALVLRSSGSPQWVPFVAPDELLSRDCNGQTCGKRLSTTNGYQKNDLYNDSTLRAMLWSDEIFTAINGCTKIYFAPDGFLHTLAIEYMFPGNEKAIAPQLYRLTSTRQLVNRKSNATVANQPALLIGGVNYDRESVEEDKNPQIVDNDSISHSFVRGMSRRFAYLIGSKKEIDSIYAARSNAADTMLIGNSATENAFRRLCSTYSIVNISTHGYFGAARTPIGTDLKPCYTDESLSQSVIALAGCNAALHNKNMAANDYDGLLSAREISRLDMSRTQLAIISACQTGLGYITADGVYGIQRGLKNAGAESMIVSLWSVNDEATCLLMTAFHRNLSNGMTIAEAFSAARHIDTYAAADYSAPQYTNAFILIDATE